MGEYNKMNTDKLKTIQSKFIYYLTDENVLLNNFGDDASKIAIEVIDGMDDAGALKNSKQFIQRDHFKRCLMITVVLKERYNAQRLNDFLDSIVEKYNDDLKKYSADLEKFYVLNDGKCAYKLAIYDTQSKRHPLLVFNILNPLLQQYNLMN